jgi:type IV pilus secretin PilQ/predicted competence protein
MKKRMEHVAAQKMMDNPVRRRTMKKTQINKCQSLLPGMFIFAVFAQAAIFAQTGQPAGSGAKMNGLDGEIDTAAYVTINVKDANISEVLDAYTLQTGQSIVVGPDVMSDNVNVRLNHIPWKDALDVILKPYGFGYQVVGDTIIINKLENIIMVEGIEPLVSKVFNLKYLDASDIKAICEALLSSRGKVTILYATGQTGWEFGGSSGSSSGGAATEGGIRRRSKDKEQIQKCKTLVITDVPASLTSISEIIQQMDTIPAQVLIEARFLEISTGALTDIGLDYIGAMENVEQMALSGSSGGSTLQPTPIGELNKVLNVTTGFPDPLQMGAAGSLSQASGLRLASAELGESGFEMLFSLIAQDDDANVLSAPRVLTLNNQEAAILVGEKFPIIESQNNTGSGGGGTTSTSLDYYENIGIQLNVIPQVCDAGYISMIVHPAVSEIKGFETGIVTGVAGSQSGTRYPLLKIREAETQVMIKSGNTAVIGGLQTERDKKFIQKIPFLGDIPFIGRLFRREKITKEKIELLIFIKATIVEAESYAVESAQLKDEWETRGGFKAAKEVAEEPVALPEEEIGLIAEVAEAPEPVVLVEEEVVDAEAAEKEELVTFLNGASESNEM